MRCTFTFRAQQRLHTFPFKLPGCNAWIVAKVGWERDKVWLLSSADQQQAAGPKKFGQNSGLNWAVTEVFPKVRNRTLCWTVTETFPKSSQNRVCLAKSGRVSQLTKNRKNLLSGGCNRFLGKSTRTESQTELPLAAGGEQAWTGRVSLLRVGFG